VLFTAILLVSHMEKWNNFNIPIGAKPLTCILTLKTWFSRSPSCRLYEPEAGPGFFTNCNIEAGNRRQASA
jgi:hypothetical protein